MNDTPLHTPAKAMEIEATFSSARYKTFFNAKK